MTLKLFPSGMPVSKRILDLTITVIGSIMVLPILTIVALLLFIINGRPLLFKQKRPGYKGKIFSIYKFRTMNNDTDQHGNLLPDSERISTFGKLLRTTSIDEIPELINVFKGEMSLVGPRPLLIEYLDLYTPEQNRRHEVFPGMTGWAQINGRNVLTWEDKFKLDIWYVDNWTFWLDIKILFFTVWKVLLREGISQPGSVTTEYFKGNNTEGKES